MEALEQRQMLAADVLGLGLTNDTGASNSDSITYEASLTGNVQWNSPDTLSVTVEFDHDSDGQTDGSTDAYSSGETIYYDPLSWDPSLDNWQGLLPLKYRTVEHTTTDDVVGGWLDYAFTLDRVAPEVSGMTPIDGEVLDLVLSDATLTFNEEVDAGSVNPSNIWVEDAYDSSRPTQTLDHIAPDTVRVSFGGGLPDGAYATRIEYVTDIAGNEIYDFVFASWELLADTTPATVEGMQLSNDSGAASDDAITYDPTVNGSVRWDSYGITDVFVEFDHDGDGVAEGTEWVYYDGDIFSYDPLWTDASLENWEGTFELRYRTVSHTAAGDVIGDWSAFTFTLDRVAPEVLSTTPGDGSVLASAPAEATVTFNETIDAGSVDSSAIWVENINDYTLPVQTVNVTAADRAAVTFGGAGLSGGAFQLNVDYSIRDMAGNMLVDSHTSQWRITAAPTGGGIPDVYVNEDDPDTIVTLSSHFNDEFDDPMNLTYEVVGNSNPSLFSSTNITGDALTLAYAADAYGTADITIRATDSDGLWIETTFTVNVAPVNDPPQIVNFGGIEGLTVYTFEGQLLDENPVGLVITFGGLLDGHSVTVTDADGYFWYSFELAEDGGVTAQTTDSDSLVSNLAFCHVRPTV